MARARFNAQDSSVATLRPCTARINRQEEMDEKIEKIQLFRRLNIKCSEERRTSSTNNGSARPMTAKVMKKRPKEEDESKPDEDRINESIGVAASFVGNNRHCDAEEKKHLLALLADSNFAGKSSTASYTFGKVLGTGSFGKVRSAVHKLTGQRVAIKSYERRKVQDLSHWKRIEQEVRLMKRLNHQNIVRMFESIHLTKRIHIIMEHVSGTNLCEYVKEKSSLSESEACHVFKQVVL